MIDNVVYGAGGLAFGGLVAAILMPAIRANVEKETVR
jgi:hypothetical protein